jgi:hypothetical protein
MFLGLLYARGPARLTPIMAGVCGYSRFLFCFVLFFEVLLLELRAHARQVLYQLSHALSPFRLSYFSNRISCICPGQLWTMFLLFMIPM